MKNYVITAGLLTQGDKILLVKHNSEFGSEEFWTLPGGTANEDENALESTSREVAEETGLKVNKWNRLVYTAQYLNYIKSWQGVVLVFESDDFSNEVNINDPDGDILDVRFFSKDEAIELLKKIPFRMMREPIVDFLTTSKQGKCWLYIEKESGKIELINNL